MQSLLDSQPGSLKRANISFIFALRICVSTRSIFEHRWMAFVAPQNQGMLVFSENFPN